MALCLEGTQGLCGSEVSQIFLMSGFLGMAWGGETVELPGGWMGKASLLWKWLDPSNVQCSPEVPVCGISNTFYK